MSDLFCARYRPASSPKGHVWQAEKKPAPAKLETSTGGLWIFDDSMDPKSRGQVGHCIVRVYVVGAEP